LRDAAYTVETSDEAMVSSLHLERLVKDAVDHDSPLGIGGPERQLDTKEALAIGIFFNTPHQIRTVHRKCDSPNE
tara:strand:+ start:3027 stop:3251 length:225 start_codon:yes stop_codon:yes gene_type:complete